MVNKEQPGKEPAKREPLEASNRGRRGPEPERFKTRGLRELGEDAVEVALRKQKPKRGWPK